MSIAIQLLGDDSQASNQWLLLKSLEEFFCKIHYLHRISTRPDPVGATMMSSQASETGKPNQDSRTAKVHSHSVIIIRPKPESFPAMGLSGKWYDLPVSSSQMIQSSHFENIHNCLKMKEYLTHSCLVLPGCPDATLMQCAE